MKKLIDLIERLHEYSIEAAWIVFFAWLAWALWMMWAV